MKIRVQLMIEAEGDTPEIVREVAQWERNGLQPETLGLSLTEAKGLLNQVQQTMVTRQAQQYVAEHRACPRCGSSRTYKDHHSLEVRTLFGQLTLDSPRLYTCRCGATRDRKSASPLSDLLKERTAPELAYLETKFSALMSYGLTVAILGEVLPLGRTINVASVHRQVQRVAERMERALGDERAMFIDGCQFDWDQLPPPGPPVTVGLDGGSVHAKDQPSRTEGWFEVIAGKSLADKGSKCFAFVPRYDRKPKRRLYEVLQSQGLQMNQSVVFLSDGGDTVRELPQYLSPESEHRLDWFHITMRLTVMRQLAKGLRSTAGPTTAKDVDRQLGRIKWSLWHGNVFRALQTVDHLEIDLEIFEDNREQKKRLKALREFEQYLTLNKAFIPNYSDRYRHGETISTAF